MYKILYSKSAVGDLKKLDLLIAARIVKKISFYCSQKNILSFAKPLKNFDIKRYRFRVGDYRVIFRIDEDGFLKILMVLKIAHRKDVYLR